MTKTVSPIITEQWPARPFGSVGPYLVDGGFMVISSVLLRRLLPSSPPKTFENYDFAHSFVERIHNANFSSKVITVAETI